MEGVLVLVTIAGRWRFTSIGTETMPIEPRVTLQPGRPVLLRAVSR
jgi:hypothetical protein